jgi:hypothetical protein
MDNQSKLILAQYTQDALNILDHSLRLFDEGHKSFYRVAATQLRILLCDTNFRHGKQEDIAVVPVLAPSIKLHLLDEDAFPRLDSEPVDLQTWLNSPAGSGSDLTIRQLIRRVCDVDGGAHIDLKPQAGIRDQENARQWIIKIGKYISPRISEALNS